MYEDGSELLTMDYVDVVCNGKAPADRGAKQANNLGGWFLYSFYIKLLMLVKLRLAGTMHPTANNLNWLVYLLYARHDHELCKTVIGQQMRFPGDKEYLYFVKVFVWM